MTTEKDPKIDKLNNPLLHERKLTDDSLVTERGNTDQSVGDLRKRAERDTDEKVRREREEADDARAQSHVGQGAVDDRWNEQKKVDDDAVAIERLLMDKALRKERRQRETSLSESFSQKREETDEHLLRERQQTDSEADLHSKLLTNEQSLHSFTKAALTTRDEFLAIVSHDLRSPIATIIDFAGLLLDRSSSAQFDEESKTWLEVISRNAKTCLRLVKDILDIDRFAEGKLELNLVSCDLEDVIKEQVESLLHIAAERGILLRAIPNLLGNALKFTPIGGSVTLRAQQTEEEVEVSVSDTGPGISTEQQGRIFDRFAQITNKERTGLGLGLYISKMLIEAHQGRLWVVSALGSGSRFSFTLPKRGTATD
jgi:signal transduction histidine kinase